jgi:hypothetical protein
MLHHGYVEECVNPEPPQARHIAGSAGILLNIVDDDGAALAQVFDERAIVGEAMPPGDALDPDAVQSRSTSTKLPVGSTEP